MSSDEQDDDIIIVSLHCNEYAASEPGSSPHRIKTGRTRLSEAERLCCDAIEYYNVDPIVYLKHLNRKDIYLRNHYFQVQKMILPCLPQQTLLKN